MTWGDARIRAAIIGVAVGLATVTALAPVPDSSAATPATTPVTTTPITTVQADLTSTVSASRLTGLTSFEGQYNVLSGDAFGGPLTIQFVK